MHRLTGAKTPAVPTFLVLTRFLFLGRAASLVLHGLRPNAGLLIGDQSSGRVCGCLHARKGDDSTRYRRQRLFGTVITSLCPASCPAAGCSSLRRRHTSLHTEGASWPHRTNLPPPLRRRSSRVSRMSRQSRLLCSGVPYRRPPIRASFLTTTTTKMLGRRGTRRTTTWGRQRISRTPASTPPPCTCTTARPGRGLRGRS